MNDILINFAIVYAASAIVYIGIITCLVASSRAAVSRSRSRDTKLVESARQERLISSLKLFMIWPIAVARDLISLRKDG